MRIKVLHPKAFDAQTFGKSNVSLTFVVDGFKRYPSGQHETSRDLISGYSWGAHTDHDCQIQPERLSAPIGVNLSSHMLGVKKCSTTIVSISNKDIFYPSQNDTSDLLIYTSDSKTDW